MIFSSEFKDIKSKGEITLVVLGILALLTSGLVGGLSLVTQKKNLSPQKKAAVMGDCMCWDQLKHNCRDEGNCGALPTPCTCGYRCNSVRNCDAQGSCE